MLIQSKKLSYESKGGNIMDKSHSKLTAGIVLTLLVVYVVGGAALLTCVHQFTGGSSPVNELIVFSQAGNLTYNVVPFANYFRLIQNGCLPSALLLVLCGILVPLPWGIFSPLLVSKLRTYPRLLLWVAVCWVLSLLPKLIFLSGTLDINEYILSLIGISIGFWIWKRLIPERISQAAAIY